MSWTMTACFDSSIRYSTRHRALAAVMLRTRMSGPSITPRSRRWPPRIKDKFGNRWQYHSRSDHHSKVACWAALFDLLNTSALLRTHVADGKVIFGVNHTMRDFRTRRKKDLDLVIARPGTEEPNPITRDNTFRSLAEHYGILCVPKTSSKSCDQAVLVYQTSGVSLPLDAVPVEINRFG
jgi:hypothetical protein